MKSLNKRISAISKLALLFSLLIGIGGGKAAELVSSDRFLFRILDQTVSLQDLNYQARNLSALNCLYDDALVILYFKRTFISEWQEFLRKFPTGNEEVSRYMNGHTELLKKIRYFYKVLRYAEDQKLPITPAVTKILRQAVKENKCDQDVLHNDSLKTNFLSLIRMELYFKSRYAGQIQTDPQKFDTVRPSVDLFVESLDKQFGHEYYW